MLRGFLTTALANSNATLPSGSLLYSLNNPNYSGTPSYDTFGISVDADGNYAIVGADLESNSDGAVYIYNIATGTLLRTLTPPVSAQRNYFGLAVAVSGNYAIITEPFWPSGSTNAGAAYIYNVTTGELLHTLYDPNVYGTATEDQFGRSVDISGNYAIVGAEFESSAGGSYSGAAYIYDVTTGDLVHTLIDPNPYGTAANDNFGHSVSISGNYAIVGAKGEGDSGGTSAGKAYIYNVTTGNLVHTLNDPNAYGTSANDNFGWAVAIDGNYAIVGAPFEGDAGGIYSGKAYIYNVTTGSLLYTLSNPNAYGTSSGDEFGYTVAISGNRALVAAPFEDISGYLSVGTVYVYDVTTGTLLYTLQNPNPAGTDKSTDSKFGQALALTSNRIIVGAPYQTNLASGELLGLNGVYSASALITQQNIATTDASSYKIITSGASSATITSIAYITPDYTGLTNIVPLNNIIDRSHGVDDNYWDVTPPWGTITYLGSSYSSVYYGSNGYLTFGTGSSEYVVSAGNPSLPKIFIFGFDNFNDGLWAGTEGTTPNRVHRVVVKCRFDEYNSTSKSRTTLWYEIRFYENDLTRIDVHQQNIVFGSSTYPEAGAIHVYKL